MGLRDLINVRIPEADLDDRDPDYIRETLPGLWLLASFYWARRSCAATSARRSPRLRTW
jgi:hypothetical protein